MNAKDLALEILSKLSGLPRAEITPEMELVGDLGIDSPKALQLLVELEEGLDIEIMDEDAGRMNRVGDVFSYVEAQG